ECLDHIQSALERMNTMLTRILDVRAIEDQHLQLYPEKLELAELLEEVIADFRERAQKKGIQLSGHLKRELFASLDRAYTLQVFENLISNAIKFSPPDTEVRLHLEESDGKVRAKVCDQGPGIAPEEQPKLFAKYQKLSARPTDGETSTGLGLSIVKKYVEAMEGAVWCESELGNGAHFIVEFKAYQ
ncbi:MAG: HAMP domain-containing sensor histidine kinase, partial [Bacteroidota bacterium]